MLDINFRKVMKGIYTVVIRTKKSYAYMEIDKEELEQVRDMVQKLLLELNEELYNETNM